MRMKLFLTLFTAGVMVLAGYLPQFFLSSVCTVQYVLPEEKPYSKKISCEGIIRAQETAEIYLDTPVIAQEVYVSVGDWVSQGDPLAQIDADLTQTVLTSSGSVSIPQDSSEKDISAQLEELYALAQTYQVNAQDIQQLTDSYSPVYQGASGPSIGVIPSSLNSPISGIVAKAELQQNVLSSQGKLAFTIVDPSQYKAVISIPQSQMDMVYEGCQATVRCSGQTKEYTGRLTKLYPTAEQQGGGEAMIMAEVTIEDGDQQLRDGYDAKVELVLEAERQAVMVPFESVRQDKDNVEYVYVYQNGRAVRQDIETGEETSNGVEVLSGLAGGEIVLFNPDEPAVSRNFIYLKGEASGENVY